MARFDRGPPLSKVRALRRDRGFGARPKVDEIKVNDDIPIDPNAHNPSIVERALMLTTAFLIACKLFLWKLTSS